MVKSEPASGTATRWTCAPAVYCALQLDRQSPPAPRTTPLPEVVTRSVTCFTLVFELDPSELPPHAATKIARATHAPPPPRMEPPPDV